MADVGQIPGYTQTIFPAASLSHFTVFSSIGLILFMFMIGLEVDVKLMTRNLAKTAAISISGQGFSWILVKKT